MSIESPVRLQWSATTHPGRFRKNNEDAFLSLVLNPESIERLGKAGAGDFVDKEYIFAVSDGMGGAEAGELASQMVRDAIALKIRDWVRHSDDLVFSSASMTLLAELFNEVHQKLLLLSRSYEECRGLGATLSLCWIRKHSACLVHVGDSRIYKLSKSGELGQLSTDHTHVGWKVKKGELNEREARTHPGRNSLQQVIGGKIQMLRPQIEVFTFSVGDRLLLCTDGVIEGLWDSSLRRFVRDGSLESEPLVSEAIVSEAVAADGKDNATAVVVEALG